MRESSEERPEQPSEQTQQPSEFLNRCLVDGDTAEQARAKRLRRKSLLASLGIEAALLAALALVPLFALSERALVRQVLIPLPPPRGWHSDTRARPDTGGTPPTIRKHHFPLAIVAPPTIPKNVPTNENAATSTTGLASSNAQYFDPPGIPGGIESLTPRSTPPLPETAHPPAEHKRVVHSSVVQEALLERRIEPKYPILAIQTRRQGTVRLRAIIGTDGSVNSLEMLSGDPFLAQAALDAVRQWHYRPTLLNGQAVEVETYITVIFQLQR